ncbi:MAG: electron transfer flavoprotein subunit alpha/FixB family protein, partial [Acidimicrobiia bacterium]|nr:electron transfer flavoprotein subunit alpha/FixB family protein [Acidimicrobiia bacterium]
MNTWVFVEESNGAPAPVGLELLTKARDLGDVTAVFLGGSDEAIAELGRHGAGAVYKMTPPAGALLAAA